MQLQDRVFAVTGGGNGIGRQVSLELLRRGARVALIDLNEKGLTESRQIAGDQYSRRITTHVANVTDSASTDSLPAEVISAHGQVDGLVNVAGIIHRFVPVADLSRDEIDRVMDVNFWGTVNMCLAFLPELRRRSSASIANVSSLSALVPFAGQTIYSASKGAVKQFSEGLFQELSGTGVAVTTIFPGNISTNLSGNSGVKMVDAGGRKVRATTPERTARQIVEGIAKGSFRVVIGSDATALNRLVRIAPAWTTRFIAKQMKSVL